MKDSEERVLIIAVVIGLILAAGFVVIVGPKILANFFYTRTPSPRPIEAFPSETTPTITKKCKTAGCSGQLCIDANEDRETTCEYVDSYACYKQSYAICEVQDDGVCGWTLNEELRACLDNSGGLTD